VLSPGITRSNSVGGLILISLIANAIKRLYLGIVISIFNRVIYKYSKFPVIKRLLAKKTRF